MFSFKISGIYFQVQSVDYIINNSTLYNSLYFAVYVRLCYFVKNNYCLQIIDILLMLAQKIAIRNNCVVKKHNKTLKMTLVLPVKQSSGRSLLGFWGCRRFEILIIFQLYDYILK